MTKTNADQIKCSKLLFVIFILFVVIICFLPWVFTHSWFIDFSETGQIGDTIGGIMSPFIAIIAAWLTFLAFLVQYKANIEQREDIAKERFENYLFEMIHIQQDITNGLLIEEITESDNSNHIKSQRGRDVFQFIYETASDIIDFPNSTKNCNLKRALMEYDSLRINISKAKVMWCLDHYFRHLYRIFKYINDADTELLDDKQKYQYSAIVRATLSQYELVLLFYNCFSQKNFKELIEKYAILNNIRVELLATETERSLYNNRFSYDYSYDKDENRDMSLEYKKSAFVPLIEK